MLKCKMRVAVLTAAVVLPVASSARAEIWRLGEDESWQSVSAQDKFLVAVAEAKKLVNTGRTDAARKAYQQLKKDFPAVAGPDFEAFVEAEMLYSQGRFAKAYLRYEKLLKDYPDTRLRQAVLDREFAIGTAYLGGQERRVLRVVKLKGDAEGVRIMEKITERTGLDSPLGLKAALAVAQNYRKRRLYEDEYLKWWEISLQYRKGQIARDALLGMAQAKDALYNDHPEHKRALFDAASLRTAKSYYLEFKALYPEDAKKLRIDETLRRIDEQLAEKQLAIGRYYERAGKMEAAGLYYNMVVEDWPGTKAAESAKKLLARNSDA